MPERVVIALEGQDAGGSAVLEAGARDVRALGNALQESLGGAAKSVAADADKMGTAVERGLSVGGKRISEVKDQAGALASNLRGVASAGSAAGQEVEHVGGKHISMRLLAHATREGAAGMLLLAGESKGAAGEVASLLAFGIRGFAHGGLLGLGIAAVTGLIHALGSETQKEAEEAKKASELKLRALERQEQAYDRLIEKVRGLEREDRATREGRPAGELKDEEDIQSQQFRDSMLLRQAERDLAKKNAEIEKDRGSRTSRIFGPNRALETDRTNIENEIAAIKARMQGTEKAQGTLDEHSEHDRLAAEGKKRAEELANQIRERIKLSQEAHDEEMRQIEEQKKALVDGLSERAKARKDEKDAQAEEGNALAREAAERIRKIADEKVAQAEEAKVQQHLRDELALLMAANEEEKKRIALKIRLRELQEQGLSKEDADKALGKFDRDAQQDRVLEWEKNEAKRLKREHDEAERHQKEREAEIEKRNRETPRERRHRNELKGSFSGISGSADDPQARRVREAAERAAAEQAERHRNAVAPNGDSGKKGGKDQNPWADVTATQGQVVAELRRANEHTKKAAEDLKKGFDEMLAAVKADGVAETKLLRDIVTRLGKLEEEYKRLKEEKDAIAAMGGRNAGV